MSPPRARNLPQSARFHAICRAASRQATLCGRRLSEQQWKIVLISAHEIVAGENPDLAIGMEGEFISLRERTADMSSARMSSLIEYCHSWAANNNIAIRE